MKDEILHWLGQFAGMLLLVLLIWSHYRSRTYPASERYSTFGPRFWTPSVDSCVLWPVSTFATVLLSAKVPNIAALLVAVIGNLVWVFYTVIFHARYGQTLGKMVTKVRVVDFRTEGKISYYQAWLRDGIPGMVGLIWSVYEVFVVLTGKVSPETLQKEEGNIHSPLYILTLLPLLWFLAEIVTMFSNQKRRALHDLIAGTVVIRTNVSQKPLRGPAGAQPECHREAECSSSPGQSKA